MERDPLRTLPPRRDPPALRGEFADIEPHRLASLPVGIAPSIPRIRTEVIVLKPTPTTPAAQALHDAGLTVLTLRHRIRWSEHLLESGGCVESYARFLETLIAANRMRIESEERVARVFEALVEAEMKESA